MVELSSFERKLQELCKKNKKTIIFPESLEPRIIESSFMLLNESSVRKICFFCDVKSFEDKLRELNLSFTKDYRDKIDFLNSKDYENLTFKILKSNLEGENSEKKLQKMQHYSRMSLYQAIALLKEGLADCVLAGVSYPTADVLRAGFNLLRDSSQRKTWSGSFFLSKINKSKKDQLFLFSDCAVSIDPSSDDLVQIASDTVKTWNKIVGSEQEPRLAFLSFSSKGSASHAKVEKVRIAAEKFKDLYPHILSDGELQFDAAMSEEVSRLKAAKSPLSGRANIFIFPDLDSANIAYKVAQRLGGFSAYGPVLQGFSKSLSDLSRGASIKDVLVSSYIASLRT